ncbi:MAG: DUF5723 family protein [Prevotellaceae bacterium]|jgi:outer membrane protein OmpA-like peptidoglycan-associated protein|nr:DUF5723 family protein [Prevotellaceae bacterium]
MKKLKYITVALLMLCFGANLKAQQVGTLYFMNNVPERSDYNPAFQPIHNVWIDLPVLPNYRMGLGNNSLSFNDVIFSKKINGRDSTITFMHPEANADDFYNSLHKTTRIYSDFHFNLLGFGFRVKEINYFSFEVAQKVNMGLYIPKDFFKLAIYGTDKGSNYDLNNFGINMSMYTEYGLGYSRKINDQWTVGGKLKFLMGQANINTDIDKFKLVANEEQWRLDGHGSINASIPAVTIPIQPDRTIDFDNIESKIDTISGSNILDNIFTSNIGFGIDLGATYRPIENLQLSAAVTDLGFIRWRKNTTNASLNGNFDFDGIEYEADRDYDFEEKWDSIGNAFEDAFVNGASNKSYTTWLNARVNLGAEYSVWQDKLGFGVLSSTLFANKQLYEELTLSANLRPCDWFNLTGSYSFLNGRAQTIGFGAQLQVLPFSMYLAIDNIPLTFMKDKANNTTIPTNFTGTNIQVGWIWVIGNPRKVGDNDKDGVKNSKDKCPDTPFGWQVDKQGCTVDTDGDGVPDNLDNCPETPAGIPVDSVGCLLDDDKDNVPNINDICPNTPEAVQVDSVGCPLDGDKDGVADYLDKCPGTPAGAPVDSVGCPLDSDGDGVADYLDQCPETPETLRGFIDATGCPKDTDLDGVADYEDNCPTLQGTRLNNGCPEIKAAEKQIFEKALQGIQFQTGKAVIKPASYGILNDIANIMFNNPSYLLLINGHTDNVGKADMNQKLSENRAKAVKDYLTGKGVDSNRMTSQGFGDTVPVADNKTAAGRTKNRRVEFIVKFEDFVKE